MEGIRILLLEDSPEDAELFRAALDNAELDCDIVRVETATDFKDALEGDFDLIVSDFTLPSFDGKKAFAIAGERRPDVPFIFVSGTLGEDAAIECLVGGATDYVLKHKFGRLVPSIQRALTEREQRTARREAERKLEDALQQLRNLFENLDEVFFSAEPGSGKLLQISPACERVFGRPRESCLDNADFWADAAAPEDRPAVNTAKCALMAGQAASFDYRIKKPDGSIRWISAKLKPVLDSEGAVRRLDGILSDVHERKELQAALLRTQRMESIGSLAAGVAHDLNNVLSPIVMGVQLMRSRLPDSNNLSILSTIESCAARGANLVKQILMFGRGVEDRRTTVDFGRLIRNLDNIVQRTFPKSIHVEIDVPSDLWAGSADPTQIEQVLINLLVNARDAMPSGGTVRIAARNVALTNGSFVDIEVRDTGTGIPHEHLDKIFEPFFTTKGVGLGTGLGLSTASVIVKNHGGVLTVETGDDGTTFLVRLPALTRGAKAAGSSTTADPPIGNNEVVLVVDDDSAIRDFAKMILESYGYRVVTAADGTAACDVYSRQANAIDAVITDIDMPGISGRQLIDALRQVNPGVRVIMITGTVDHAPNPKDSTTAVSVLEKPFTPMQLLQTLKNLLSPKKSMSGSYT